MNTVRMNAASIVVVGMMLALGNAFAAEQAPTKGTEPSKQAREEMAKVHEEMATCLRSEKSMADCRKQMHAHCMAIMGHGGCPMMQDGMQHPMRARPAPEQ